jgi:hypothetical protein
MPSWLTDLLKDLGVGTPAIYALATYRLSQGLDKRASSNAKSAVLAFLQPKQYEYGKVADAFLEVFNHIYTPRLLSWRAFARSALFTFIMSAIFLFEAYRGVVPGIKVLHNTEVDPTAGHLTITQEIVAWTFAIGTNIVSDYFSLFAVKGFLASKLTRYRVMPLIGALTGIAIVALINFISIAADALYIAIPSPYPATFAVRYMAAFMAILESTFSDPAWLSLLLAAFVVHLWLPLLSISMGVLRMLNYFRKAVGLTQWFLEDGSSHPFEGIGYVSSTIVFVGTVAAFKI